ncbi:hypothetical protein EJ07DRAFT_160116, partial [Lizonia empirigonia]
MKVTTTLMALMGVAAAAPFAGYKDEYAYPASTPEYHQSTPLPTPSAGKPYPVKPSESPWYPTVPAKSSSEEKSYPVYTPKPTPSSEGYAPYPAKSSDDKYPPSPLQRRRATLFTPRSRHPALRDTLPTLLRARTT